MRHDPDYPPGPWPAEPLATVVAWPAMLGDIDPTIQGGELYRLVDHRSGPERHYFVEFDEPQLDGDGDGPYVSAEVWEGYVELLD